MFKNDIKIQGTGHLWVLPSGVPSSVIDNTLTRIVRGPGSELGWGLSNSTAIWV